MAFKDIWEDLQDAVEGVAGSGSDVSVEPINKIAHAVIENESKLGEKASFTDYATEETAGVVKASTRVNVGETGVFIDETGFVNIAPATQSLIKMKNGTHRPITPDNLDFAVSCATNQEWKSDGYTDKEKILPISTEVFYGRIGDISTALDELHAYAVALSGGAE